MDAAKLGQIDRAEEVLRGCGIRGGRVRHHAEVARIELPEASMPLLADPEVRRRLAEGLSAAGFRFVAVDLEPYRQGRLHDAAEAGNEPAGSDPVHDRPDQAGDPSG